MTINIIYSKYHHKKCIHPISTTALQVVVLYSLGNSNFSKKYLMTCNVYTDNGSIRSLEHVKSACMTDSPLMLEDSQRTGGKTLVCFMQQYPYS